MLPQNYQNIIFASLKPYKPLMVGIFGSYARNENTPDSDLDILVDFEKTVNLLDLIGLEQELSDQLGVKVDLVTKKSIHPQLEGYIYKDLQRIL